MKLKRAGFYLLDKLTLAIVFLLVCLVVMKLHRRTAKIYV